jgi:hypothetical protein
LQEATKVSATTQEPVLIKRQSPPPTQMPLQNLTTTSPSSVHSSLNSLSQAQVAQNSLLTSTNQTTVSSDFKSIHKQTPPKQEPIRPFDDYPDRSGKEEDPITGKLMNAEDQLSSDLINTNPTVAADQYSSNKDFNQID